MINATELKPVIVVTSDLERKEGYMYKDIFIPKNYGSMTDNFIYNYMNWKIKRKYDRIANPVIEKLCEDLITGIWYRIIEK